LSKSKSRDANAQIDFPRLHIAPRRESAKYFSLRALHFCSISEPLNYLRRTVSAALNMANQFIIQYEIQRGYVYKNKATIKSAAAHGPAAVTSLHGVYYFQCKCQRVQKVFVGRATRSWDYAIKRDHLTTLCLINKILISFRGAVNN
jgi:hypothetical protein